MAELDRSLSEAAGSIQHCDELNGQAWAVLRSDPARAEALSNEARRLAEQAGYSPGQAAAMRTLSGLRMYAGHYDQALLLGLEALELAEHSAAAAVLPSILNLIASCYRFLGDTSESLTYYRRQEAASLAAEDRLEAGKALAGIGAIYSDIGDFGSFRLYSERSLAIFRQLEAAAPNADARRAAAYWTTLALNNLCFALFRLNQFPEAIAQGLEGLELARRMANSRGELLLISSLAETYLVSGAHEQSLALLEEGRALAGRSHEPDVENDVLRLSGEAYLQLGQDEQALAYFKQALAHSDQYKLRRSQYLCHQRLGEVYKRLGDFRQALKHHELFQSYKDAVFSEESAAKLQNLEVLHRTQAAQREAEYFSSLYEQTRQFNEQLEDEVRARTEDLRRAYEQLERLDRTKTSFITVTAHELRTPLTVLNGYTQILLTDSALRADPYKRDLLTGIVAGASRMQEIINTMLLMVKIDSRTLEIYPQPIALDEVLHDIAARLRDALRERHQSLSISPLIRSLPAVEADLSAIEIVFQKIIENAIKYTPDGKCIEVFGYAWDEPGRDGLPDQAVQIVVSDPGIGIDPASLELIFGKFFQTGDARLHSSSKTGFKGGGPGLGLAIARGIVEAHHGRLWAESDGQNEKDCPGSRFFIVLPLKQPPPAASIPLSA